jgi:hypothetical protein
MIKTWAEIQKLSELELATLLRGLADGIERRQPRPAQRTRAEWAAQIWAVADALDGKRAKRDEPKEPLGDF